MSILDDPQFPQIAHAFELREGLPLGSLRAVALQESGGDTNALNKKDGGRGLMQFTDPGVIAKYKVDPTNAWDSLRAGAEYLGDNMKKYGNFDAALADYNGGPKAAQAVLGGRDYGTVTANYVPQVNARMQATAPSQDDTMSAVERHVVSLKQDGLSDLAIVQKLMRSPIGDAVHAAQQSGMNPTEIVQKIGGQPLQIQQAAQAKIDGQGFGTNMVQGGANALGDAGLSIKQIVASDPQEIARLQQQAKINLADPERQALGNTAGGAIGSFGAKAAPAFAAGVLTGGGSVIPMVLGQAAAGGLSGALTPTTEDGERAGNIAIDAGLGAGGGLAAKGLGVVGEAAWKRLRPSADAISEATAIKAARDKLGWSSTSADLNPTARSIRDSLPAAKAASEDQMRRDLSRSVLERIGQTGDELTPENVAIARSAIYKDADSMLQGVSVPADTSTIAPKLSQIVSKYEQDTLPTYRSGEVASAAKDLLDKIGSGNMSGQALVQARKNIMNNAWKADGDTKSALRAIGSAIDDHLTQVAPGVEPVLDTANKQWQHLQVVENALNRVNGQGDQLTPKAFANSVKAVSRDQFQAGTAPYQDIADTLLKSQGDSSSKSLSGLLSKHLDSTGDGVLGGAAFFAPGSAISAYVAKKAAAYALARGITSDSPTMVRLLTGVGGKQMDPTLKSYISKALAGTTSAEAEAHPETIIDPAVRQYIAQMLAGKATHSN